MRVEAGMQSEDKVYLEPAEAGAARTASPCSFRREPGPVDTLVSHFWSLDFEGIKFVVLSPPVCVNLLG